MQADALGSELIRLFVRNVSGSGLRGEKMCRHLGVSEVQLPCP